MAVLFITISLSGFFGISAVDLYTHKRVAAHPDNAEKDAVVTAETSNAKQYIFYACLLLFLLTSLMLPLLIDHLIRPVKKMEKNLENQVLERTRALNDANEKLTAAMNELKITQKKIIQAETQKSLTTIVAGFAHEINNPLTGILGSLDLVELKTDVPLDLKKKLSIIRRQTFRIKGIIEELNRMNPEIDQTKLEVDLANLLDKLIKISGKKKEYKKIQFIHSFRSFPGEEMIVRGNHAALWQVFEGIIENAAEAIEAKNPEDGEIRITLEKSPDNAYYITRIKDNGGGFENSEKAFDPFFTTKSRTQKKGIGLSIAYNVAREHKGNIIINNNEKGATLEIYLPAQEKIIENSYKMVNSKP